jgi:TM2 domain-containing membrane protein YozV
MAAFSKNRDIMRGQVLGVDTRTGDGIVSGDDGRRYAFRPADWAARGEPAVGMQVDFEIHENRALTIFPVPGTTPSPVPASYEPAAERARGDKLVAALLAFLLGTLGVHRFYLGRIGSGIAMLLLSCTLIGLLVTVPWALIDMVRFLVMSDEDFARDYGRR